MIECLDWLGSYYRLPSLADVKQTEATTTRARAKFIYSTREVTLTMATGEVRRCVCNVFVCFYVYILNVVCVVFV